MNRPTREEYEFDGCHDGKYKILNGKTVGYVRHLENYCDALEKALDKVCEMMVNLKECAECYEFIKYCPFYDDCTEVNNGCYCSEKWKDWALKDEH